MKKRGRCDPKMKQALGHSSDESRVLALAGVQLQPDESMVASSIIHPAIYWKGVAVAIFGFLLLFSGTFFNLGVLFLIVGGVMLTLAYMTRRFLLLAATDKRVLVRSGIVYADMIELRYAQIESVELGITPIGQIFGYGNVIVTGTGQRRIIVPFVTDALNFRSKVNDVMVNK